MAARTHLEQKARGLSGRHRGKGCCSFPLGRCRGILPGKRHIAEHLWSHPESYPAASAVLCAHPVTFSLQQQQLRRFPRMFSSPCSLHRNSGKQDSWWRMLRELVVCWSRWTLCLWETEQYNKIKLFSFIYHRPFPCLRTHL